MSDPRSSPACAHSLDGVTTVLVTAYRDGTDTIAADVVAGIASRTATAGIHVVTALGNTAEVQQLTEAERDVILRAVIEGAAGGADPTLVAGVVGGLRSALEQAERARALGYHAVMVHEPTDPFGDAGGLMALYAGLADRSALPLVLYLRSTRLGRGELADLVTHPAVVGVKFARPDMHTLATLLENGAGEHCTWINGLAESAVPAFGALGVTSFTSGIANARPDVALDVHGAACDGDLGRLRALLREYVGPVEAVRAESNGRYNVAVIKELLRWHGIETGGVRPPHSALSEGARARLEVARPYDRSVATTA